MITEELLNNKSIIRIKDMLFSFIIPITLFFGCENISHADSQKLQAPQFNNLDKQADYVKTEFKQAWKYADIATPIELI